MQPETLFKMKVQDFLRELPGTWFTKIQQKTIRGTPDMIACIQGRLVAMELKAAERLKADKLQIHTLLKIQEAEGISIVVFPENWEQVKARLTKLSQRKYV